MFSVSSVRNCFLNAVYSDKRPSAAKSGTALDNGFLVPGLEAMGTRNGSFDLEAKLLIQMYNS